MTVRAWFPLLVISPLWGCAHVGLMPTHVNRVHAVEAFEYAVLANNAYGDPMYDQLSRWIKLPPDVSLVMECGNDPFGLAYSIFRINAANGTEYVLAFRGTEGVEGPEAKKDWKYGNFGQKQQLLSEPIARAFADAHLGDKIVFAGHSLGGALAIHNSTRITGKHVYAFNTSPQFFPQEGYDAATDPSVRTSVTESGEVLSGIRITWKGVPISRVSFNCFGKGSPVLQHGMLRLAVCLTRIAASEAHSGPNSAAVLRARQYIDLNPWMLDATEHLRASELENSRGPVRAAAACPR